MFYSPNCICPGYLERAHHPFSPGMPVGTSYVCFLVLSVAVTSVPPRDLGEGRAACRGLWTKGSVGLGRRQLVSTPRAYQLPLSLLEAAPSIQHALRKRWLSRQIQDLGRVGELVGSASRSREDAVVLRRRPSEQQGRLCGCWGVGAVQTEDRLQHREPKLIPAWRHLLPGELWIEKSITGVTVSDNT